MYSRNVATFWDFQAGFATTHSLFQPPTLYWVLKGLLRNSLKPKHIYSVSDEGDVTARLRQENDFLVTQRLILQPYAEVNLSAQDVDEQEIGAGFVDGEIGLQTRYEFTRKFAPLY